MLFILYNNNQDIDSIWIALPASHYNCGKMVHKFKFSTSFATIVINQKYKNNYVNGLKVVSIFPLIGKGEHQQEEDLLYTLGLVARIQEEKAIEYWSGASSGQTFALL